MKFKYRAKELAGAAVDGEIDAASLAEARARLRSQGLFVLELDPLRSHNSRPKSRRVHPFRRVSRSDLVMMLSQLTIMCQSGVDLAEGLRSVTEQCRKPALKTIMQRVTEDVTNGLAFSEAMRRHPDVFDESLVAGITAAEHSGALNLVLGRLTQLLRGDQRLWSSIGSMLIYPAVLCAVTFGVVNALIFFVLPQFAKVFADLGKPAPPLTQMLLGLGDFVRGNIAVILPAILFLMVAALVCSKRAWARRAWDYATLHLAVIRTATNSLSTGRTFRMLGTMVTSGVPLLDAIRLCAGASRNSFYRELFSQIERDIIRGDGIGRAMLASPLLPAGAAQMVATAERTGKLGEVLQTVGEHFEDEGERYLRDLIKLLEPAIIVSLGVVVAAVVLSVVLPLLDVSTMSH